MSRWRGKYVIGLTGNIATGKSVIRKMLEHLGAYGIDADALSHRAIAREAPGYKQVVDTFGKWILDGNGEVDRDKLGRIVFNDPAALASLEKIVHPLVEQAIGRIIERATQSVIVIEAIKLIEGHLAEACDSVWVVYSFPEQQKSRLMNTRHLSEDEAQQRVDMQAPQEDKVEAAQVVIKNIATFEDTWRQVVANWKKYVSVEETQAEIRPTPKVSIPQGALVVKRGGPRDAKRIAELMTEFDPEGRKHSHQDVMADLGEKAFLMLYAGETLVGLIGWQVENLIARTTNIIFNPAIPLEKALPVLIGEMEQASNDLQCEVALIFVSPELAMSDKLWRKLGYDQRTPKSLGVLVWQEAAEESAQPGTVLLFKQLRSERVLRPI
jgi:dephospho-CoA kinase